MSSTSGHSDPYNEFAAVYDEWQEIYRHPFVLALTPRLRRIASQRGVPSKTYVDLACGTGTLCWWWTRHRPGWSIYGVDRSRAMILAARGKGPRDGSPTFLIQDLAKLSLPVRAGFATCLFDSLNHVTRTAHLARIFRRIRTALEPGGLFVFDLVDEVEFARIFSGDSIVESDRLYVGIESSYRERRGVGMGTALFTFFWKQRDRWKRSHAAIVERCWCRDEIETMLELAGFEILQVERIDPTEDEDLFVPRAFWTCRRPRIGTAQDRTG